MSQFKKRLREEYIEEGTWTPTLLNCQYDASICFGRYIRIGKCVTVWFHIRPKITALEGTEFAHIAGLPYLPTWPQGAGSLSVCMCTNTEYVPGLMVSNEITNKGTLEIVNNINGATSVKWRTTDDGYWLCGTATYFID